MSDPLQRLTPEELGDLYEIAFKEWAESEDSKLWDATLLDGLDPGESSGFDDVEAGFERVDVSEDGQ